MNKSLLRFSKLIKLLFTLQKIPQREKVKYHVDIRVTILALGKKEIINIIYMYQIYGKAR